MQGERKPLAIAPLLWGVEESAELLSALNEMNLYISAGRVIWIGGQVLAVADIPAPQLTIQYLDYACQQIGGLADHFDEQLQERFGGNTQSGQEPPSKPQQDVGYL